MSPMGLPRSALGLLVVVCFAASAFTGVYGSVEEGAALVEMMFGWNVTFPSWRAGGEPCDGWEHVNCSDGRVTFLNLTQRGLSGRLSPRIGELSALEFLGIRRNQLKGEFPDELANCRNLSRLEVSDNYWDIEFPAVFTRLPKLDYLHASSAGLSGRVPDEFYNVITLEYLFLGNNTRLTGNLENFCKLTNLVNLTLWEMKFDENVLPLNLPRLTKLQYFNCHDCLLIGTIPESYGNLVNMMDFNVRRNALTGGIPDSFKKLTRMFNFRVDTNFLLGPFPNWVFDLWPNLTYLYLDRNQFYGAPYNISYLETRNNITTKFEVLRWNCNYLTGPEPCSTRGNNNCSSTATSFTIHEGGPEVAKFSFSQNCYDDSSVDYQAVVQYCGGHTLSCTDFMQNVVINRGCPLCPPDQDPEVERTAVNGCPCGAREDSGSGVPEAAIIGLVVGLVVIFGIVISVLLYYRRKQFSFLDIFINKRDRFDADWEAPEGVHRFTVNDLAKITSDFDEGHIIGAGGFGNVYYGTLQDGRKVAIKRASADSFQGHKEFHNEVELLSRLHHRHLVKLEGFCSEKEFQVLVYEYMSKGNLGAHLFPKERNSQYQDQPFTPLSSVKRLEIAYEVAQGLEYLHSFADPPVIHRDVKASNILLDEHMMAKLADFGISKAFEAADSEKTHLSTRPAGTAGYLDPEYFLRRQITTASDVYAYGVVLLELVTGQYAVDHSRLEDYNLVEWAKKRFRTAGIVAIIDPTIAKDYSVPTFTQMTELALQCASFTKSERPTMKEVIGALLPLLPKTTRFVSASSPVGDDIHKANREYFEGILAEAKLADGSTISLETDRSRLVEGLEFEPR